ncbi:hypothetical protein CTheo_5091 [Ceratobasidium theobromae]|uniref:Uncharacterized protein n=1 Tax=Ceratobasidium theobromae TaxID=1582974 RepID=A0A5N5QJM2_9AGAM|nr:hypothetical protein CTheo_5091 [Ceratobasidium theobromae]
MVTTRPLFCTIYRSDRTYGYRDQLNIWSSRIGIRSIEFQTTAAEYRDENGQQVFWAIPIFPQVYADPLPLRGYSARGGSRLGAQEASMWALQQGGLDLDMSLVRWSFVQIGGRGCLFEATPCLYGNPTLLSDRRVIGRGSTKRGAEEESSRLLFATEYYCVWD